MTASSSKSGQRLKLALIFALPIILFVGLISLEDLRERRTFSIGMERAEVYDLMGKPSNADDKRIAFWSAGGGKGKSWRDLDGKDGWVAVFDANGRAMNYKISLSALALDPSLTEEEAVTQILDVAGP